MLVEVLESGVFTQDPDREAGDIAPEWGPWVRYDDPEAKTFKLNVERQNGRAAMLGRAAHGPMRAEDTAPATRANAE